MKRGLGIGDQGSGIKDQGSGIKVGSEFSVQSSEPVGTSIARPPASPHPSLPLKGKAEDGGRLRAVPTELSAPAPALAALERLRAVGFPAYLVGGCVRDTLLGRAPGDWDITTAALPEQVEAVFAGERLIETGLKHGTVTVLLDGLPLEITTFRTEAAYSDHRHPDAVAFTPSLTEDLARRDFTINAMAWTLENTGDGSLCSTKASVFSDDCITQRTVPCVPLEKRGEGLEDGLQDPFGGQADLERKLIRCVGDPYKRFEEDALRILRALRFAAQLDFAIDPATAAAAHALRDTLELVSRERIAVELTKLLCGPAARRIVVEYWEILSIPLPELAPMAGLDQRSKYHCYDVLEHCAAALEAVPPEPVLRWAALLHDVGKPACFTLDEAGRGHFYGHAKAGGPMAREIMTRLRFDKDTVNRVSRLVELHDYPIDPPVEMQNAECRMQNEGSASVGTGPCRPRYAETSVGTHSVRPPQADTLRRAEERAVRKLIGRLGEEDFFRLLALKRADSLAHHPDYRNRTAACDRLAALAREILTQPPCFTVRDLVINGNDLLALGLTPGPEIGRTLDALLEQVLAGALSNDRERLLAAVKGRK